jgi:hypothetical protein
MSHNGLGKRLTIDPITQNAAKVIQDDDQTLHRSEIGFAAGGPIVRDRLFYYGTVVPRIERQTRNYNLSSGGTGSIHRDRELWNTFGKVTYQANNRLRFNVSTLYTPDFATGKIVAYDDYSPNLSTLTPENIAARNELGWEIPQINLSGSMDYTLTDTSLLSVRTGYMRDDYEDTGINTSQTFEYATAPVGIPVAPQFNQPAGYSNLPRTQFNDHDRTTRKFINVEFVKAFDGAGSHNLKVGSGFLRASNDVVLAYPNNGYVTLFWNQAFTSTVTGITDRGPYGYYTIDDIGTIGKTSGDIWHMFAQDNWAVSPRLTLNLGLRAERELIPTMRPDIQKTAIKFNWDEKLAPRLGFAYDLRGDGRMKLAASYGRYFDWTKYEVVRGSFGGDVWTTRYRSLDTLDPSTLGASNLLGRNLWTSEADSFQDHRVPSFGEESIDPDLKPMSLDAFNAGVEYQLSPNSVVGVNYVHTRLIRTIEDLGTVVNGSEVYIYSNPGEGLGSETPTQGLTAPFATPKPKRLYDAVEFTFNRRFSSNWFGGASYVWSRLYGNYPGTVNTDEIVTPGRGYAGSQEAFTQTVRPGTNASRGWDIDEIMWDSHGNKGVDGRLPTDRPHVLKVYGSYNFEFGTTLGANVYAGSGTPLSKTAYTVFQIPVLVDGRGSQGRTPMLNQTDIFVSHQIKLGGEKAVRLELNVLNLFNQQTERHRVSFVNRVGANGRRLISSAIDLRNSDLARGYDYQAMLDATPDAAKPASAPVSGYQDPRYNMADVWNPGIQGRFSLRFLF